MKATVDCLECIVRQALRAARIAGDDSEMHRAVINSVVADIPGMDLNESPAVLSLGVYQIVNQISGVNDAYKTMKEEQNKMALLLEPELKQYVRDSREPIVTAIRLAAAGNIIDLGILQSHEIDPHEAIGKAMNAPLDIEHTEKFLEDLKHCDELLYLLDNSGEIVFDKVLIRELQKYTRVTAVVKAGPIINDACMEDAKQVGVTDLCEVIDNGGAFVGSPLSLIPDHFRKRMEKADIILGKGQGNYETVDDFDGNVYLLLKIKCEVVAQHSGLPLGAAAFVSIRERTRIKGT
jgi:damage-control phosphatase, subfamily I